MTNNLGLEAQIIDCSSVEHGAEEKTAGSTEDQNPSQVKNVTI